MPHNSCDICRYRIRSLRFSFSRHIECLSLTNLNKINSMDLTIDWWAHKKVRFDIKKTDNIHVHIDLNGYNSTKYHVVGWLDTYTVRIAGSMNGIQHLRSKIIFRHPIEWRIFFIFFKLIDNETKMVVDQEMESFKIDNNNHSSQLKIKNESSMKLRRILCWMVFFYTQQQQQ